MNTNQRAEKLLKNWENLSHIKQEIDRCASIVQNDLSSITDEDFENWSKNCREIYVRFRKEFAKLFVETKNYIIDNTVK